MKAFLFEYGKALSTAIITMFIFAIAVQLLFSMTDVLYPRQGVQEVTFAGDSGGVINIEKAAYNRPVIIADNLIYLSIGDTEYDGKSAAATGTAQLEQVKEKYLEKATAYAPTDLIGGTRKSLTPEIRGVENIDTTTMGAYPIAYIAENEGHVFVKNVTVVVR